MTDTYFIVRWRPTTFGREACVESPTPDEVREAIEFSYGADEMATIEVREMDTTGATEIWCG